MFLNTLFSVSEAVMYAQLVDRLDLVGRRGGREGSKERKEEGGGVSWFWWGEVEESTAAGGCGGNCALPTPPGTWCPSLTVPHCTALFRPLPPGHVHRGRNRDFDVPGAVWHGV